jgi:hypothetical protein
MNSSRHKKRSVSLFSVRVSIDTSLASFEQHPIYVDRAHHRAQIS